MIGGAPGSGWWGPEAGYGNEAGPAPGSWGGWRNE